MENVLLDYKEFFLPFVYKGIILSQSAKTMNQSAKHGLQIHKINELSVLN